jgi:FkbM family methyltransferase
MNFSGLSQRSRLGRLLRFPLRYIPNDAIMPVLQGKLRGYRWVTGSSNHGCWLGSYEYEKQQTISNIVKPGTIAFDLGAHVGFYTLLFSKMTGSLGRVFAFEPFPPNIYYLQKHIALNHIMNVQILEVAVSDSSGVTSFLQQSNSSMGHIGEFGGFDVEKVAIDELVKIGKLPVPNYMKIDIEGAEYKALIGSQATLREFHPIIFLATHGNDVHGNCCEFLLRLGYELQSVEGISVSSSNEIIAL